MKYCLSIAGFDPSGGAGLLADIKVFQKVGVVGMGVMTVLTAQHESKFQMGYQIKFEQIEEQLLVLCERYEFDYIKIGLIIKIETLIKLITLIKRKLRKTKVIWDPIMSSSDGFIIHKKIKDKELLAILRGVYCMTPNYKELDQLTSIPYPYSAKYLSTLTNVIVKGGHREGDLQGVDEWWYKEEKQVFQPSNDKKIYPKHGSGCVFSAFLTAYLCKTHSLRKSIILAKKETEIFLASSKGLLGSL
ncbi:MAG: bifunctional hydroxymethylpyrimidine kinase/phosphomethylpyrimidine kinase [Phycisphaerales bacterium]|nr:bifunctional hydroxymethylpyrimidine kinase/phosphomethylpyrimidine kinase [Phycisphaerales bacterium]